jgi:hypothetical protein
MRNGTAFDEKEKRERKRKRESRRRETWANFHFAKYREAIFDMLSFGGLKALHLRLYTLYMHIAYTASKAMPRAKPKSELDFASRPCPTTVEDNL